MERKHESLPPGYRFLPGDEDLIGHYLMNRVNGIPSDVISEANVYDMEPWKLPGASALDGEPEVGGLYFLTKRRKRYAGGTRADRTAGDGSWKDRDKEKPILNSARKVIGYKRDLVYQSPRPSSGDKNWLMKEYRLSGQSSAAEETVLCKITRSKWGSKGKNDKEYEAEKIVKTTGDGDYSGPQQNVAGGLSPSFVPGTYNEDIDAMLVSPDIPITMDQLLSNCLPESMGGYSGCHQNQGPQQLESMGRYSGSHQNQGPQQLESMDRYPGHYQMPSMDEDSGYRQNQMSSMDGYSGYQQNQMSSMDGYSGHHQMLSMGEYSGYHQNQMSSMKGYLGYQQNQMSSMDGYSRHHQMPSMDEHSGYDQDHMSSMDGYSRCQQNQMSSMDGYSGYHQNQMSSMDGYFGHHLMPSMDGYPGYHQDQMPSKDGCSGHHRNQMSSMDGYSGHHQTDGYSGFYQKPQLSVSMDGHYGY